MAKCIKNMVLREKYRQQNRGKCARETKLAAENRVLWKKKKEKKNKNGDSHMQVITATLVRH